jgi:hypothetical protein
LHSGDKNFAREIAFHAPEFLGRDHDNFIATVYGHVLRPFSSDPPHQFAEPGLCVLQQPAAGRLT